MRLNIREQLGALVLFCSLIALAVVAIATWVTNYDFVVSIRLSSLALTASLYSQQLLSNLALLNTAIQSVSTRVLVQASLQRYNDLGNTTTDNWIRAQSDLATALSGGGSSQYLLQARLISKNATGNGRYGLINVTGSGIEPVQLPYNHADGTSVFLGDAELGYPSNLYPNFTYSTTVVNSTFNQSNAFYDEEPLYSNSTLLLGPWQINETFALLSITVPIVNNTSSTDILGWITIVMNAHLVFQVQAAQEGLGDTGSVLIVGPAMRTNRFPPDFLYSSSSQNSNRTALSKQEARFVISPFQNTTRVARHAASAFGRPQTLFSMQSFPAVLKAVTMNNNALNNAGSLLSSNNEENDHVSVGYALPKSDMVDWVIVVEQAYDEAVQPINHLRNVLIACVFGTTGGLLLFLFPVAHYSVRPIRRLRAATKQTVEPYGHSSDESSIRTSISDDPVLNDEENQAQLARKEGFLQHMAYWRRGRQKSNAERREQHRRHTFRIPGKVQDRKHFIRDELTDLTTTFNEMSEELMMQYERLEQKVLERTKELEQSKLAAEAANESKTLFIANISHELKTPLNGILGIAAVCMHEEDQSKIKRSLGIIYKSGDLLLHLLTDLLTFSKNQIGQQLSLDEKEFHLADISSQILSIFEKQAREGGINLSVRFEGPNDSPAEYGPPGTGRIKDMCLWGDQHRILQVIINLVSNSLKFTPRDGSIELKIRCTGETIAEKPPSIRKDSNSSRLSKISKISKISKGLPTGKSPRSRLRGVSSSDSSSGLPGTPNTLGDRRSKNLSPYLEINVKEPKVLPAVTVRDRSSSPPPLNAKILSFEFEVRDTGPGIPPSQQQKVFEPFVQGDLGLSKKYGGTGLGLSICLQLAHLMGGSIGLESEEGVGSVFTMKIPLRFTKERADSLNSSNSNLNSRRNSVNIVSGWDEPYISRADGLEPEFAITSATASSLRSATPVLNGFESPASKPRLVGLSQPFFAASPQGDSTTDHLAVMEKVAAEASRNGDKVRVLVAEDNIVNQEVVLRMLKLEDIYDVTVAKDGQEAIDLVKESMEQEKLFNLIFMDIQMPNVDGLQSTRLIRGMGFSAPIVALTAFSEDSNVQECLDSGMDFFLPKPIRRPALKQVLKKYCATIAEAPEEPESPKHVPKPLPHQAKTGPEDPVSSTS